MKRRSSSLITDEQLSRENDIWEKYERGSASAQKKPNPVKSERIARKRYWNAMCQYRGVPEEQQQRQGDIPIDPYVSDPITNEPRNIYRPTWKDSPLLLHHGIVLNEPKSADGK